MTPNILGAFNTSNQSVFNTISQLGQGYYIPAYQRGYSWDDENMEQFIEDLTNGVESIPPVNCTDNELRFWGTLILVTETSNQKIQSSSHQFIPNRVDKVIDGQQRLSTIMMMATELMGKLHQIKNSCNNQSNQVEQEIIACCDDCMDNKLFNIISTTLRSRNIYGPRVIRESVDRWDNPSVNGCYTSELSKFLNEFIQDYLKSATNLSLLSKQNSSTLLCKNAKVFEKWLTTTVMNAHSVGNYTAAPKILQTVGEQDLWSSNRPLLVNEINSQNSSYHNVVCQLAQILSVSHYLLDRCCFTVIQPINDDWAFDMFQSLNATGTPLTALEVFKPLVVNTIGTSFSTSNSARYFEKVEDYLKLAKKAQQKNKYTNDLLTSFFVSYKGIEVASHFSAQRKALNNEYQTQCSTGIAKERFVQFLGNYAYFYSLWIGYDGKNLFEGIQNSPEAELISMLILFLKNANHKMAISVLARAYEGIILNTPGAVDEFAKVTKMTAAYFFFWRTSYSNAGLDKTYRDYFKNNHSNFSANSLGNYFKSVLQYKNISSFSSWKSLAVDAFKYDSMVNICKFALLVYAHDTIKDPNNIGMVINGTAGCADYLNRKKWVSPDLKTVEHVAPQAAGSSWDQNLYTTPANLYQSIGNLTLLSQDFNSSVSNSPWSTKVLYYQCVAQNNPSVINSILNSPQGNLLNQATVTKLQNCTYNSHLAAIADPQIVWDKAFVEKRRDNILDIVWKKIYSWI